MSYSYDQQQTAIQPVPSPPPVMVAPDGSQWVQVAPPPAAAPVASPAPAARREALSRQRAQNAEALSRLIFAIGLTFTGAIALLLLVGAIVASFRPQPPPAPSINPSCIAGCGGVN